VASHGLAQGCLGRRDPSSLPHQRTDSARHSLPSPLPPTQEGESTHGTMGSLFQSGPHAGKAGAVPSASRVACLGPSAPDHWAAGFHTHSLPSSEHRPSGFAFDPLSSGQCWGLCPLGLGGTPHTTGAHRLCQRCSHWHTSHIDDPRTGTHPSVGLAWARSWATRRPRTPFPHKAAGARSTA